MTAVILHAQQMGYDYINGQPWSATRAREGTASGLGVLFNTGADSAKWMRINSDYDHHQRTPYYRSGSGELRQGALYEEPQRHGPHRPLQA